MKVAYWPGCVSRGFTPELHGSMAAVAPLLDIELIEPAVWVLAGLSVITVGQRIFHVRGELRRAPAPAPEL